MVKHPGVVSLRGLIEESNIFLTLRALSLGENLEPTSWIGDACILDAACLSEESLRETLFGCACYLWCVLL
jgi:hypothetical protein